MRRYAFTLLELLTVVAILVVLVMLLGPAVSQAWHTVYLTQCQQNLKRQYQAQVAWRGEQGSSMYTRTAGWVGHLMPYVEHELTLFFCPASPSMATDALFDQETGEFLGDVEMAIVPEAVSFKFVIYTRPNATPGVTPLSAYPIEIPLDGSSPFATLVEQTDDYEHWMCDDGEHMIGQGKGGDDIDFDIYYKGGVPSRIVTRPGATSSRTEYRYELWANDEIVTDDYYYKYAKDSREIELDLGSNRGGGAIGSGGGELIFNGISISDYGLNKGTFKLNGLDVPRVDNKQIFILDYPKPIADYASTVGGGDDWDKYFILDPDDWMDRYGHELEDHLTWRHYQALRHMGKANVLFCDGRVETVAPEDLYETNALWRYGDR